MQLVMTQLLPGTVLGNEVNMQFVVTCAQPTTTKLLPLSGVQPCLPKSFLLLTGESEDAPINATAGSKPILTNLQTGPGVDFGAIKQDTVTDAVKLRQKIAGAAIQQTAQVS